MDVSLIWQVILILVVGIFLLRLSGRKSISQMTIAQTVIMISIGTLLIQPVTSKSVWTTIVVAGVLIGTMLVIELLQLKWDGAEGLITGRSTVVIEGGRLQEENLRKLRLSVDQLEMHLRQKGIGKITDVQWATIEPSGQLGYQLADRKKPATKEDVDRLLQKLDEALVELGGSNTGNGMAKGENIAPLFKEIEQGHDLMDPPERLQ
ncbi:membrane protein [Bacillus sp. OxB-1]|uniref:DUF421 domain-containing protein n=1 Tax=Bacillus sp. (strain OxB-1) TaxID=98228 RepID=UPI0005820CAE|nr:DUF421 domain-containing protein [Bacillus sp. OxB-1]BAQ10649.1 membrane protein [Bacillus sp. OxB-1]